MRRLTALLAGGANGETWLPASAWHQIFDENEADEAAAELNRNGLLRTPEGPGLQIIVKVRNKTHRVYAVKQRLSDLKLQDSVRGYDGSYSGYLSGQGKNSITVAYPLFHSAAADLPSKFQRTASWPAARLS